MAKAGKGLLECSVQSCIFFFQAEDGIRDYKVTGVQTCALPIFNKTGTGYTLGASSGGLTGASAAFNVTPGNATQLAFVQQPTNASAGVAISPAVTVQALDINENVATGFTDNVTMAIGSNAGGGTLSGNTTVNAAGGLATFPNLSINKARSGYTLN